MRGTEVTATIGVETGVTTPGVTGVVSMLAQEDTRAAMKKQIPN